MRSFQLVKFSRSTLFAYFMLALVYSVQLEEPFNILPLRQYSETVNDSVNFVAAAYEC